MTGYGEGRGTSLPLILRFMMEVGLRVVVLSIEVHARETFEYRKRTFILIYTCIQLSTRFRCSRTVCCH
jgi:hypothetical protein